MLLLLQLPLIISIIIRRRAPGASASVGTITTASDQTLLHAGRPALVLVLFPLQLLVIKHQYMPGTWRFWQYYYLAYFEYYDTCFFLLLLGAGRPAFLLVLVLLQLVV